MLYTYSTQRYDPSLKRQPSSLAASLCSPAAIISSGVYPPTIFSRPSGLTIKEPSTDNHSLSHVLSITSSDPCSSRWYDDHSGRFSALANTEGSGVINSDNTSATSFQLSACESSTLMKDEKGGGAQVQQQLFESLLSAIQVEAHIPSRTSVDSHYGVTTEETSGWFEGEEIQGQVRLVSSFPSNVAGGRACNNTATTRVPIPDQLSPSPLFCHVHPEYDSDCDNYSEDTASVASSSSLPSVLSRCSGGEGRDDDDLGGVNSNGGPITSTNSDCPASSDLASFATSTSRCKTSPMRLDSSESGAEWTVALSGICEETPRRLTPDRPPSDRIPPVASIVASSLPGSPTGEARVWWRRFSKHQHRHYGNGCAELSNETPGPVKTGQPVRPPSYDTSDTRIESREESNVLPPSLPPSPPVYAARTKSGVRKVLSVIFPCIPVSPQKKVPDEEDDGLEPKEGSRVTGICVGPLSCGLMKSRSGESGNRGVVKQRSSGMLLEVRVERQVSRIVD